MKRCVKLGVFVNAVPGFDTAPRSGQRRLRSVRRGVRRCGQACARGGGRRLAAPQCRRRSGGGVRDRVKKADITARIVGSAAEIGAAAWNACANPAEFGRSASFHALRILRGAAKSPVRPAPRTGWQRLPSRHRARRRDRGLMPLYLKNHSARANMSSTMAGPMRSSARAAPIIPSCRRGAVHAGDRAALAHRRECADRRDAQRCCWRRARRR